MNEEKFKEMREKARQYAFFNARRKRLENYKNVLLYRLMKEISSKEELKIADQKRVALKTPEYVNLLIAIRDLHKRESECSWFLNKFAADSESFIASSGFDRKNNWNIHNM